jgi:ATP-dependent DNA helicase RecQ
LRYFGEIPDKEKAACGKCGNCNAKADMADITVLSQKILSCVYRMKGSFGKNMVIDVLRGSKSTRILSSNLDKLSTYNICKESKGEIQQAINHLTINNFLEQTNNQYPLLKLGARAAEILRQGLQVEMRNIEGKKIINEPQKESLKFGTNKASQEIDQKLFARLKALRYKIASQQKVPPYIVFHDTALIEMCAKLPKNKEDFAKISGVGAQKLQKYGEDFLKAILEYVERSEK